MRELLANKAVAKIVGKDAMNEKHIVLNRTARVATLRVFVDEAMLYSYTVTHLIH